MNRSNEKYLRTVYENNFEIGNGNKQIDESTYEVDKFYDENGIVFLSEWFFDEKVHEHTYLNSKSLSFNFEIPTQYCFPDSNQNVNKRIMNFHKKEGFWADESEVFITEGSTPMLSSIVLFAKNLGFDEILSISPLYFNIFKVADLVNIPIKPVNKKFLPLGSELSLPKKRSFLMITDPIWSVGRHHDKTVFEKLKKWQKKTKSLIFVDGSFSYMDWSLEEKKEPCSILDPDFTFRLICPTKTLALNGLRFSYLICPPEYRQEISRITSCTIGSSCYMSHILRDLMFKKMIKRGINPVGAYANSRFKKIKHLFDINRIKYIEPNCGFFMFVELEPFLKDKNFESKYMWIPNEGLDIFDKRYKQYVKLNLIMREESFSKLLFDLRALKS